LWSVGATLQVGNAMLAMAGHIWRRCGCTVSGTRQEGQCHALRVLEHPVLLDASGCWTCLALASSITFQRGATGHLRNPRTSQDLAGPRRSAPWSLRYRVGLWSGHPGLSLQRPRIEELYSDVSTSVS
jgi:hypothetical protein